MIVQVSSTPHSNPPPCMQHFCHTFYPSQHHSLLIMFKKPKQHFGVYYRPSRTIKTGTVLSTCLVYDIKLHAMNSHLHKSFSIMIFGHVFQSSFLLSHPNINFPMMKNSENRINQAEFYIRRNDLFTLDLIKLKSCFKLRLKITLQPAPI